MSDVRDMGDASLSKDGTVIDQHQRRSKPPLLYDYPEAPMKRAQVLTRAVAMSLAGGLASCGLLDANKAPAELGGSWIVQQVAGASLGEHVEIFLEIDPRTGGVTGFTGCNRFVAQMSAFGDALSVGQIQERQAPCPNAAAAADEVRFLAVLPLVRRYARRGNSLELLPQGYGEALLKLRVDNFGRLTRASVQQ